MADTQTETAATETNDSFVSSLLEPTLGEAMERRGGEEPTAEEPPAEPEPETAQEPEPEAEAKEEKPEGSEVEALIQELAKEHPDLDIENPAHRRILKRAADKELFIRKLKADNEALIKGAAAKPETEDTLTEFERSLLSKETAPAEKPAETASAEKPKEEAAYGDVGDAWKSEKDAYSALNEAWESDDLDKVNQVESAMFLRRADNYFGRRLQPWLQDQLETLIQKQLGDVLPDMRQSRAERRMEANADFAKAELRKVEGFSGIDKMFEPTDDTTLKFREMEVANTPMNRIMVENPELLDIYVQHKDPNTAERLTFMKRYRAAMRIHRASQNAGIDPAKAKELMQAGSKASEKTQIDRARQGINAGPGATGLGTKPAEKSFVRGLSASDEVPFSSLFETKR